MGAELKPAEYLRYPGVMENGKKKEAWGRFKRLLNEFEGGNVRLDPSDDKLLELSFYTASVVLDISNSQLRRMYGEIMKIRNEAEKARERNGEWENVLAALNKARVVLAYTVGRQVKSERDKEKKRQFELLYNVLDEALRRATRVVERNKADDEARKRVIDALHFLAQGIIAFHQFLGGNK